MGHIIPAGSGFDYHRKVNLKFLVDIDDLEEPAAEEAEAENPLAL